METSEIIIIVGTLVFLEGILSIDNAAVLGAMANNLPKDKPVPWPAFLKPFAKQLDRIFGNQQGAALKVGLFGAYFGRVLMLLLANVIIHNPWLKLLGAAYLFKLGLEGVAIKPSEHKKEEQQVEAQYKDFWTVVLAIELADLAFSLDNVVAAVAISDVMWVVILGVAIGIVTMRFAAGIFTWLITKEPHINRAAYLLVLVIAIELFIDHFLHIHVSHVQRFFISVSILVLTFLYTPFLSKTILSPLLRQLGIGAYMLNEGLDLLLLPVTRTTKYAARGTRRGAKGLWAAYQFAYQAIERRLRRSSYKD